MMLPRSTFFSLFASNPAKPRITIFMYEKHHILTLSKFEKLPENQTFMLNGVEYTLSNKLVKGGIL